MTLHLKKPDIALHGTDIIHTEGQFLKWFCPQKNHRTYTGLRSTWNLEVMEGGFDIDKEWFIHKIMIRKDKINENEQGV